MRWAHRAAIAFTRALPRARGSGRLAALVMDRVASMTSPVILPVHGARIELDQAEFIDRWLIFAPQLYDRREIDLLERSLREGDVFLDVGAYVGVYTWAASRRVGASGLVIAVEPDPRTFERLRDGIARNELRNVRLVNAGVSDRRERLRLAVNVFGNRGGSSFEDHPEWPGVDIDCLPLLAVLLDHKVQRLRGAKLDIEGFEHRVLTPFFRDAPPDMWPDFLIVEAAAEPDARARGVGTLLLEQGYREAFRTGQNRAFVRA
jgi:FkbM family methyltransferase